jgi:hypothetical protein
MAHPRAERGIWDTSGMLQRLDGEAHPSAPAIGA